MQICIIVCEDERSSRCQVFEMENRQYVSLKILQRPPSSDQLWFRKDEPDGNSFALVSMSIGKALKCSDPGTSQVVLCDVSERDLWSMNSSSYIVCKRTSQLMYLSDHNTLYCGDEKKQVKSVRFQKVVCRCSNYCCYG